MGLFDFSKALLKWSFLLLLTAPSTMGTRPVQKCAPITHTQCLLAGYQNTAAFPGINGHPFQQVKGKELAIYVAQLTGCSKYSATILCSLYFPKCVEHLPRPVLPCQSVCNDFVHSCSSKLNLVAMKGMFSAMCDLLPVYNGNQETCFLPEGFNVSLAASGTDKTTCHRVHIPQCQDDLHYNFTFISRDTQNHSTISLMQSIIATNCSSDIEKFTCFTRFPPCFGGQPNSRVQVPCKAMCLQINKTCSTQFNHYNIPINCDFLYPDQDSSTGLCTLLKWPAPWTRGPSPTPDLTPPPTPTPKHAGCKTCDKIIVQGCANAGYSHTFHFKDIDGKPYQTAASTKLEKFLKLLKCSQYAQTILCSLYIPKCDVTTCSPKPVLPCRRVCHEFVRSCDNILRFGAMHGLLVGLCDLLPWNNTAETPCFWPPGFKPTSEVYKRHVCFPISNEHNDCTRDFSYNTTFISPSDQLKAKFHALQPIIDSKCSPHAEKFFCYTRIPPCGRRGDVSVNLPCRWMCNDVASKCKDVFEIRGIPIADCNILLPDGQGDEDGICRTSKFPVPFRHFRPPPTHGDGKKHGASAGLIVGIIILIIVIIAVVVGGVLYYRKRKQQQPFEPKELHNIEGKYS